MEKVANLKEQLTAPAGVKVMLDDENFLIVGSMQNYQYLAARESHIVTWRAENKWPHDQPVPQSIDVASMIQALPDLVLKSWGGPLFEGMPYSKPQALLLLQGPFSNTVIAAARQSSQKLEEVKEATAKNSAEPSTGS